LSSTAPVPQEYPASLSASPCWCRSPLPLLSTSSLDTVEVNHHLHIFVVLCWCCVWVIVPTQIHTLTHTVTSNHPVPYCPITSTRSPSVYSMYSPFLFLSICLVAPPIGECIVRSVSLYDYLICFLSCSRSLYVPVPFQY